MSGQKRSVVPSTDTAKWFLEAAARIDAGADAGFYSLLDRDAPSTCDELMDAFFWNAGVVVAKRSEKVMVFCLLAAIAERP